MKHKIRARKGVAISFRVAEARKFLEAFTTQSTALLFMNIYPVYTVYVAVVFASKFSASS